MRKNHDFLIWCVGAFAIAFAPIAAGALAAPAQIERPESGPNLVGYGCKGAAGPLYAAEEDHFPAPCVAVEAWR